MQSVSIAILIVFQFWALREIRAQPAEECNRKFQQAAEALRDGRYAEGKQILSDAQPCVAHLPENHVDRLRLVHALAGALQSLGEIPRAEELEVSILKQLENATGAEERLLAASSRNNLAGIRIGQGRWAEGERLLNSAVETFRNLRGPEDRATAQAISLLGQLYLLQGRYEDAEGPLTEAVRVLGARAGGAVDVDLIVAEGFLGRLYLLTGRSDKAEPVLGRAHASARRLPAGHPLLGEIALHLAVLFRERGDYARAAPLLKTTLKVLETAPGMEHPGRAAALAEMAHAAAAEGKYGVAAGHLERAMEILRRVFGPASVEVSGAQAQLALAYLHQGRLAESQALLENSLRIDQAHYPASSVRIATIHASLAQIHEKRGNTELADRYCRAATAFSPIPCGKRSSRGR